MEETKGETFDEMKENNPHLTPSARELARQLNPEIPLDYKKIPLRNNKKKIIDYALVSNEDYEEVNKYKWCLCIKKDGYKQVSGIINKINILLSHFIKGKPKDGYVIDHNDNNSLNNCRDNLREITYSENSQNRKKTTKKTTSQYIGVSYAKNMKKWNTKCCGNDLGHFENEIDAAKQYDKFILLKFGKKANSNNLITFDEVKDLDINDLIVKKKEKKDKDLPNHIYTTNKERNIKYFCKIEYDKIRYRSPDVGTIKEAIKYLDDFTNKINEIKNNKEIEHNNQEITRDENNNAIIYLNKDKTKYTIVDDDLWYELSKYSWSIRDDNYVIGKINSKNIRMHRYILNTPKDLYVDHIDNNSLNNKKENLRPATPSQNNFNRTKSINEFSHSQYKGVTYSKEHKKFLAVINHKNIRYNLGCYENEVIAGLAYNLKAQELFGNFANLNIINLDNETYEEYKKEIYKNWINKKTSKFIGVSKNKNNLYRVYIHIDKKKIFLNSYKEELQAALAYNLKKIELNKNKLDNLKLNELNLDNETYEKYKKEILEKWNKK
jgi:hypothetical protein